MRKVIVVALREYNAAVRTWAFVIGLAMMPILMGGSFAAQWFFKDDADKRARTVGVVDLTPGQKLFRGLEATFQAIPDSNTTLKSLTPTTTDPAELKGELNAGLRRGDYTAWLLIGPDVAALGPPADRERARVVYRSKRAADQGFVEVARQALTAQVVQLRAAEANVSGQAAQHISREVRVERELDLSIFVPFGLMMLMFMLVLMAATPLMQGVVEEKMQRIAEVLLGSVSPFRLMLGKLIGMTAVSLTISAVYLGGAYWAARHYGVAEYAPTSLLVWFVVFQALASLMFGSLFIAVGAACTDMRETQNLLWPVMMLAVMPMFFLGPLMRSPNSPVIVAMSYFPFATPSMMVARLGSPDGALWWEPFAGAALMVLTTLLCVWVAGRIFRVGILLMGKGANLGQMARWVVRG